MARLYATAGGTILRFLQNQADMQQFPESPEGAVYSIDFDLDTNSAVRDRYFADPDSVTMPGGVLTISGQPYTINPPAPLQLNADEQALAQAVDAATSLDELKPVLKQALAAYVAAQRGG